MKERPILFSGPMVQAILEGRKTQTRRVAKLTDTGRVKAVGSRKNWHLDDQNAVQACPFGQPGDRLWVREKHARTEEPYIQPHYLADGPVPTISERHDAGLLRVFPSIHMPRWASRINLEITGIRVERLQEISEADAMAEGAPLELGRLERTILGAKAKYRSGFVRLWQSINGPGSWDANPWVWVIEFRRMS